MGFINKLKFKGWSSINKKGVKVATTLGTAMEPLVKAWFPNAEIKSVEAPARGYQEVLAGRADVFVTSNLAVSYTHLTLPTILLV